MSDASTTSSSSNRRGLYPAVTRGQRARSWLLIVTCLLSAAWAFFGEPPRARARVEASAGPVVHGLAPLPGNAKVPLADRPPGALEAEEGPSPVIFPEQDLPLRFNHRLHVTRLRMTCTTCHERAVTSTSSADRLLPPATRCDGCHMTDHGELSLVRHREGELIAQCGFCHVGYREGQPIRRVSIPKPNLRFSHATHAARNIACGQCHGHVERIELATRDQLPRMRGCFSCHRAPPPARGQAKGECRTCHLTEPNGALRTGFATGKLYPPGWLNNAAHDADFLWRHQEVAGNDSQFCASCHTEKFCLDCHDGRVRPRTIHPNDFLSMHAVAARQNVPRCSSCHRAQSFCVTCHQRAGITLTGPVENVASRGRFHPPQSEWTQGPRGPRHHAWEAQRNLEACVSCHVERDCAICHATAAVGGRGAGLVPGLGQGVNPHPAGFRGRCRLALQKNARPCLVCHDPADPNLAACR